MKIFLIFFLSLISEVLLDNRCSLKIADNQMSSLRGGHDLIYDEGVINERWEDSNIFTSHQASYMNDIEYLYATEFHIDNNLHHEKIKASIMSNDTSIAIPNVEVKGEKGDQLDRSTLEIIYNCNGRKKGIVKITMTISPDHCDPFKLVWHKICKEIGHIPKINVGVTAKSTEIINGGVKQNILKVFNSEGEKFMIKKEINSFSIYLSYSVEGKEKAMKEPQLSYDANAFQSVLTGELSKGGILTNHPQVFTITFACTPLKYTKSDIELILNFQNNDIVTLYFQKECETVGDLEEFDMLYTIYWIILILMLIFLGVVIYYYFERNGITLEELYNSAIIEIKIWYGKAKFTFNQKFGENSHHGILNNNKNENIYEENDLVDITIKTDNKNFDSQNKENSTNVKYNNFTTDYGGI